MPALVIVNVPPRSSSGFSVPARAASASRSTSARELLERRGVAAADDRDDEPLVGLHGDAEVVALEVDDLVALEARVQLRVLLERGRDRLERERHELLQVDVGEVALLDERDRRHLAVRPRQVLGDLPPHPAQRLAPPLGGLVLFQHKLLSARARGRRPR